MTSLKRVRHHGIHGVTSLSVEVIVKATNFKLEGETRVRDVIVTMTTIDISTDVCHLATS